MRKNIYIVLKISACFFILLFTLSYYGCSIIPNLNSGTNDTIFFGNYKGENIEWIVLTTEGDKKLLLSKYVLDACVYCKDYDFAYKWSDSYLCKWLNETFMNEAFNESEQAMLTKGTVYREEFDNDTHSRKKVSYTNSKKVFCLTSDEMSYYRQGDITLKQSKPTSYVKDNYGKEIVWNKGKYQGYASYWERGYNKNRYYGVQILPSGGAAVSPEYIAGEIAGVRPAVWVTI